MKFPRLIFACLLAVLAIGCSSTSRLSQSSAQHEHATFASTDSSAIRVQHAQEQKSDAIQATDERVAEASVFQRQATEAIEIVADSLSPAERTTLLAAGIPPPKPGSTVRTNRSTYDYTAHLRDEYQAAFNRYRTSMTALMDSQSSQFKQDLAEAYSEHIETLETSKRSLYYGLGVLAVASAGSFYLGYKVRSQIA